jgi:hypothetical protein
MDTLTTKLAALAGTLFMNTLVMGASHTVLLFSRTPT